MRIIGCKISSEKYFNSKKSNQTHSLNKTDYRNLFESMTDER